MKNTCCFALAALVAAACCAEDAKKEDPRDKYSAEGWKLSWSEEFNGTGAPDRNVWKPEVGFIRNHEPHFLLMNLALGGWGNKLTEETKFPMEMKVDWVRYYERKDK